MNKSWKTAVIGVTPNSNRYAFKAVTMLTEHKYPVVALGFRNGSVAGNEIILNWPQSIDNLKVITLYIGAPRQPEFYDYLISLNPKKIIFNPGTENEEFYSKLTNVGIEYEEACTLVLLSTGVYSNGI
jgi:predicted CoA-binding protein